MVRCIFRRSKTDPHGGLAIGLLEIGVTYIDRDAELNKLNYQARNSVTKTGAPWPVANGRGDKREIRRSQDRNTLSLWGPSLDRIGEMGVER